MKKGKWNYTEDIEYRVVLVRLHKTDERPMHWQNALVGELRQVVEVNYNRDGETKAFYIDNQDGSGLKKISAGGGPDSYSAHVAGFDLISEVPESEWQQWDPVLHKTERDKCDAWQAANFPVEFERMKGLR